MLLKELLEDLQRIETKGDLNIDIKGIAYDSRKVAANFLFVCIEGFKVDGHQFINTAIENGARALLVQKAVEVPEGITVVTLEDTRFALSYVSDKYFGHPSGKFNLVGVTGTKGKTTTTYMIKSVLEEEKQKVGLIGTIVNSIGNEIIPAERTTPESYDLQALFSEMVEKKVESVVMEVSSHALELHRVSCGEYDIGIFTNLSRDHLDFHETFENYLNAKIKLFGMCKKGLVNIDSQYGEEVIRKAKCEVFTYGIEKDADIKATNIKTHPNSVEFYIATPWGNGEIKVNIPGIFTVYNALSAIGVCLLMGVPMDVIKKGMLGVKVPGRSEVIDTGRDFTIIIDYAHSPDSLENILTTVKNYAPGRVVSVFGCGGDRDRTKRPIMGEISGKIADYTVITSDNPRTEDPVSILKDIEEGIKKTKGEYTVITDRREAIKSSIVNAKPKDIIVLAGKGHETYQIFKDKTIHFDEREVVKEILDELK
ncbi:MAG: UDP-N-acetylmuramoyl-L-alanyl-D-glutamate--2,6-diaminopimelate ligase [Clostridia bacterium]|nr:UDP-N-acetylmuramoyl-L-alanyl-D-glutamate--2,6-diaminopimelate ligase [Clostridia bacterium]